MLFMVVEHIKDGDGLQLYGRIRERPVTLPEGLVVLGSWLESNFERCFQLMECDDVRLFQQWILGGLNDIIDFEIIPVVTAKDTRALVAPYLDEAGYKAPGA